MYALGLGSAVVRAVLGSSTLEALLLQAFVCPRTSLSSWFRALSLGGSLLTKRHFNSSSLLWAWRFCCCSFMAVAWYIDSSDTAAIIHFVASLNLD
mmetsp:Transcript_19748/g.61904  ORF Transcript_19748/g.61904 Transcript_19748/m.61904 type:complete len:96 (-) Transcript_19748:793-1080(-)